MRHENEVADFIATHLAAHPGIAPEKAAKIWQRCRFLRLTERGLLIVSDAPHVPASSLAVAMIMMHRDQHHKQYVTNGKLTSKKGLSEDKHIQREWQNKLSGAELNVPHKRLFVRNFAAEFEELRLRPHRPAPTFRMPQLFPVVPVRDASPFTGRRSSVPWQTALDHRE